MTITPAGALIWEALDIAFRRMGMTSPNPPVGAVIAKDGAVVARGGTGPYGAEHAEVDAIVRAGLGTEGAEMYVSLEPCCHYGKTPPCTDAVIAAGIRRVVIPLLDPNPLVAGKGVAALAAAGIEVRFEEGAADAAVDLYRPFKKSILRKRPFIISKCAVTIDGRSAALSGDSKWISSPCSRLLVHRLRSKVDAVIIGKGTFMTDRPQLTARPSEFGEEYARALREKAEVFAGRKNFVLESLMKGDIGEVRNPLRVVIGLPDRIDLGNPFFSDANHLVFERRERVERLTGEDGMLALSAINIHPVDATSYIGMIGPVLDELSRRGVMCALLEGGGRLAGSFHDAGEIDQYLYFIAPKVAGNGLPAMVAAGSERIAESRHLRDVTIMTAGEDVVIAGYREPYHFEML